MKVLLAHNAYRHRGGEDAVVEHTQSLLRARGHSAELFMKSSKDLPGSLLRKAQAFFSGVYSPAAARELAAYLDGLRPDVVHVHNVYPLLSPSILAACRKKSVPVVMTLHNYRLICPIAVHFRDGLVCEQCRGGREYWCLLNDCRKQRMESAAYALRIWAATSFGWFRKNVTRFIAISDYVKTHFVDEGYPADRIDVVPNMVPLPSAEVNPAAGEYAAFSGRMSEEKGISTLLAAAEQASEIPVKLAGGGDLLDAYRRQAPKNADFLGFVPAETLDTFYGAARFLVMPSEWYETFGLVAIEAMGRGIPVIASRIGNLQELIRDDETGLLFEPGNGADLANKMKALWNDPERCRRLGQAARRHVRATFNEDTHYEKLMATYEAAAGA